MSPANVNQFDVSLFKHAGVTGTVDVQEELNRSAVLRGKSLRATFW
jgi:hypothetical protein